VNGMPFLGNADFTTLGAGTGALATRPRHYVPIQVPQFDEVATIAARQQRPQADPVYRWVYRPEMQFSLFDLEGMEVLESDGQRHDLLHAGTPAPVHTGTVLFDYTLAQDPLPTLERFSPLRELILSLAGAERQVDSGPHLPTGISLEHLGKVGALDSADFLTLRLYQNGDDANVLWEFALWGVDLDIDSDNTERLNPPSVWVRDDLEDLLEDDAAQLGKLVQVNDGDMDGDGVPNYADGFDLFDPAGFGAGGAFTPMVLELIGPIDLTEAKLRFHYPASDPAEVIRTGAGTPADPYVYTPAPGTLRIWTVDGATERNPAEVSAGGHYVAPGRAYLASELGAGRTLTLYVEAVANSPLTGDQRIQVEVARDGLFGPDTVLADAVRCTLVQAEIVPDWDRDGNITDDDRHQIRPDNPWRFWVNNDDDADGVDSNNDIPGDGTADYSNDAVDGLSDLADFFPLFLDLKDVVQKLPPVDYDYRLKQADAAVAGFDTDLKFDPVSKSEQAGAFLHDIDVAELLVNETPLLVTAEGTVSLTPVFLDKIANEGMGVILLEGTASTDRPLVLEVASKTAGNVALRQELPLSLDGVEKMFRHVNLRGDAFGLPEGSNDPEDPVKDRPGTPDNYPDALTNDTTFVFVHGYNVDEQKARGWHSEVFKRLFWSGSNARFYGVTWYGVQQDFGDFFIPDYHQNVINAFDTAWDLTAFVNALPGKVVVAAHSLGNMVVSSAIQDYGAAFDQYFAIDAAVVLEAYDGGETPDLRMIGFGDYPDTGDVAPIYKWSDYDERLYASEWHKRFTNDDPPDERRSLTWRDRFKDVGSSGPAMYNYFSSTEEVLAAYDGDSVYGGFSFAERGRRFSFAKQEKFKGDRRLSIVGPVGSTQAGWGFNLAESLYTKNVVYDLLTGAWDTVMKAPDELVIDDAFLEGLKTKPFFRAEPAELFGPGGSDWAGLHRDELLAKDFPARTLPVGANPLGKLEGLEVPRNLDMPALFKTDAVRWPRGGPPLGEWRHSDLRTIPYLHVYPLYDDFVSKGGLQ